MNLVKHAPLVITCIYIVRSYIASSMDLPAAVEALERFDICDISWRRLFDSTNLAPAARVGSNGPIKSHHFDDFFSVFSAREFGIIWSSYSKIRIWSLFHHFYIDSLQNWSPVMLEYYTSHGTLFKTLKYSIVVAICLLQMVSGGCSDLSDFRACISQ